MARNLPNNQIPKPKESVSILGIFVFLGVLFLIFVSFLIYLRFSNFSPLAELYALKPDIELSSIPSLNSQLNKSNSSTLDLRITESALTTSISMSASDFPLRNPELKIEPDGVHLSGKSGDKLWSPKLDILLKPETTDEKLTFTIVEVKSWGVSAPAKLVSTLSDSLGSHFANILPQKENLRVIEARSMVGYLVITVGR